MCRSWRFGAACECMGPRPRPTLPPADKDRRSCRGNAPCRHRRSCGVFPSVLWALGRPRRLQAAPPRQAVSPCGQRSNWRGRDQVDVRSCLITPPAANLTPASAGAAQSTASASSGPPVSVVNTPVVAPPFAASPAAAPQSPDPKALRTVSLLPNRTQIASATRSCVGSCMERWPSTYEGRHILIAVARLRERLFQLTAATAARTKKVDGLLLDCAAVGRVFGVRIGLPDWNKVLAMPGRRQSARPARGPV